MKFVLNILDNGDSEGRNGPAEIYVCGVLIEMGVRKTVIKWQTSSILSKSFSSVSWIKLESLWSPHNSKPELYSP